MEGIANFIIPMLKNQTVNTSPFSFCLQKVQTPKPEPLLVTHFSLPNNSNSTRAQAPIFNLDRLHFTPAFLLPCDQLFCRQNLSYERLRFQQKIQNTQEKSLLRLGTLAPSLFLKASPPSSFCQICHIHYSDYQSHIQLPGHRQLELTSPANQYIRELTSLFTPRGTKRKPIAKGKRQIRERAVKGRRILAGEGQQERVREMQRGTTSLKSSNASTRLGSQVL